MTYTHKHTRTTHTRARAHTRTSTHTHCSQLQRQHNLEAKCEKYKFALHGAEQEIARLQVHPRGEVQREKDNMHTHTHMAVHTHTNILIHIHTSTPLHTHTHTQTLMDSLRKIYPATVGRVEGHQTKDISLTPFSRKRAKDTVENEQLTQQTSPPDTQATTQRVQTSGTRPVTSASRVSTADRSVHSNASSEVCVCVCVVCMHACMYVCMYVRMDISGCRENIPSLLFSFVCHTVAVLLRCCLHVPADFHG